MAKKILSGDMNKVMLRRKNIETLIAIQKNKSSYATAITFEQQINRTYSSTFVVIKEFMRAGLVTRRKGVINGRTYTIEITEKGDKVLKEFKGMIKTLAK